MVDPSKMKLNRAMRIVSKNLRSPDADWDEEFSRFKEAILVYSGTQTIHDMDSSPSTQALLDLVKHPGCDLKTMWPNGRVGASILGFVSWIPGQVWKAISKNPVAPMWVDEGWPPFLELLLDSGQEAFFHNLEACTDKMAVMKDTNRDSFKAILPILNALGFPDDIDKYFKRSDRWPDRVVWVVGNFPTDNPGYTHWYTVGAAARLIDKTFRLGGRAGTLASSFAFEDL